MSYVEDVGGRLREVRQRAGWSLQEVEARSDGVWKAAVVGSYERGDRNISAARLVQLSEFYGVTPSELLASPAAEQRIGPRTRIVVDLARLSMAGGRFDAVVRYCRSICAQRRSHTGDTVAIRRDDLRVLAMLMGCDVEELGQALRLADAWREES